MNDKMTNSKKLIIETVLEKGGIKQRVYKNTIDKFLVFKEATRTLIEDIEKNVHEKNPEIPIKFIDKAAFEFHIQIAGDILVFLMHTNVFDFDKSHMIWKLPYVKNNPLNAYCGMIQIYNFLADSFKFNREDDLGYMVARVFINHESHFFVEGKRQLGYLYNNFSDEKITKTKATQVVESAILYVLDFDLLTPPYDAVSVVSLSQISNASRALRVKTAKRLGFQFSKDDDSTI
jgi:hypothetical protein